MGLLATPGLAHASEPHSRVVVANAVDYTPQLVKNEAFPKPHVDAVALLGGTTVAGGLFDTVTHGGASYPRRHLFAFDSATGAVSKGFVPQVGGGQVWALATDPDTGSVYVGGNFKTINGVDRAALVKLDLKTGAIDPTFKPSFNVGRVNDLEVVTLAGKKRLVVASNIGKRLFSLNPTTGVDDRYFTAGFTEGIPGVGSWGGGVAAYAFAIDPSKTDIAVTGNFMKVGGVQRVRFAMLDLGTTAATLSSWYYPGFAKPCAATRLNDARRIAYLQGLDWSPDGSAFTVAATGKITDSSDDIWYQRLGDKNKPNTTVCDAVGRFRLADDTKPAWINYTGGDSVWAVADTGPVVYASGHFRWFDNPDGYAAIGIGDKTSGAPAAERRGIAAINTGNGLANAWNPGVASTIGGKAFLATRSGLWVANDSPRFGKESHFGIAYAPVP